MKANAPSSDIPAPQGEIRPCPARCWSSAWPWLKGNSKLAWVNVGGRTEKPSGRSDTPEHLDGEADRKRGQNTRTKNLTFDLF